MKNLLLLLPISFGGPRNRIRLFLLRPQLRACSPHRVEQRNRPPPATTCRKKIRSGARILCILDRAAGGGPRIDLTEIESFGFRPKVANPQQNKNFLNVSFLLAESWVPSVRHTIFLLRIGRLGEVA